jgi:galactonate dehydratase
MCGVISRRSFALLPALPALAAPRPSPLLRKMELLPVRVTERTLWLLLRLTLDNGMSGLGEASDAFGFSNTSAEDARRLESELRSYYALVEGKSPLGIEAYRQAAFPRAKASLLSATACSAIEHALWDLYGQLQQLPIHALLGGAVRSSMPVYANINRATRQRAPAGFAETARRALADGFRHLKLAPFDGYPKATIDNGIACVEAVRAAVGSDVAVMVDCHSYFNVQQSIDVARRLEPLKLAWYEEPMAPTHLAESKQIRQSIAQRMAGGETLFGVAGFAPLCREKAFDVIMPDVKHCGGLLEMRHIAALAAVDGIEVAPHNPSGPVSTLASAHVCATLPNATILEMQYGEVPWRAELLSPAEPISAGHIKISSTPGLGARLNEKLIARFKA